MKQSVICRIGVLVFALVLAACGGASTQGPMTWLDRPLDGAALPLGPVTIQAHASDADGVASFEFTIDDTPLATAPASGGRLGEATAGWTPMEPGTYTVRARAIDSQGNAGFEATSVVTVGELPEASPTAPPEPEGMEIIFFADPDAIPAGGCAILRWEVYPPAEALLDGEGVPPAGEREVCPEETRPYELFVPARGQMRTVTLHVESEPEPPPPSGEVLITFTADRTRLLPGECTTLRWSVDGGFGFELNGQPVERSGQMEVCPEETTPYWIAVDAGDRIERREVVIVVEPGAEPTQPPPPPSGPTPTVPPSGPTPTPPPSGCPGPPLISSFTANPSTITAGQSSTLNWGPVTNGNSSVLVRSVVINPGLGEVGSPGSRVVSPGSTTTYTMVATGCGGTTTQQVTVVVNPAAFSADLAITDFRAEPPSLEVRGDITNHGPGTVNNVTVQLSCQWDEYDPIEGIHNPGQMGPMPILIGNLSPGQTQVFNTDITVRPGQYQVDFSCSIQVPFNDPNPGNNTYSEQGW